MDSYEEILDRMKNKFTELSGAIVNDDSDVGIRMRVLAGEVFSLQNNVQWLQKQMFANTASGEQLDYIALERGINRKTALCSSGTLKFKREVALNYDIEIPEGTVCSTSGINPIRVKTTETAVLKAGELAVTVNAISEGSGTAQNTSAGTIKVLVTPPAGITSVENESAFTGGFDAETDDELRERILDSYKNVSNGTNCSFYKEQALKYDGIYSASVIPLERGTGTVDIYVAAKGGVPSDELVSKIESDINKLREINVDVKVNKATTIALAAGVEITLKDGYNYTEVKKECEDNITDYFNSLKIGEPFLVAAIGNAVYKVDGVKNYSILPSISTDRYMTSKQLAIKGSIQISEG